MPATLRLTDKFSVTIPGNTPKEIIQGASFWFDLPSACGNPACKSKEVFPKHRLSKGFNFFEVECKTCHHTLKISEAKETHEFFIRWDAKWEAPQRGGGDQQGTTSSKPSDLASEDDIPF